MDEIAGQPYKVACVLLLLHNMDAVNCAPQLTLHTLPILLRILATGSLLNAGVILPNPNAPNSLLPNKNNSHASPTIQAE